MYLRRVLRSIPPIIVIVLSLELLPIPVMMLDYIRIIMSEGIRGILKAFITFILMIITGVVLFIVTSVSIGLLDVIWSEENEDNK